MTWPPLRMLGSCALMLLPPKRHGRQRHHPHRLAVEEGADVVDHAGEIGAVVLRRHVAEMRREHDIVHLAQRMVERQRLDVEHVEAGAGDLVVAQGRQQRRLIDDRPARGVDDIGGRLHQAELLGADQPARALREHDVDGDEVGLPEQVLLAHVVDADLLALLGREVLAPGDDLHAERLADLGGAGAELAEAEDAERHALEVGPDRGLPGHARPSCGRSRSRCGA